VHEPFQLPDGERQHFFEECMIVAKALNKLFAPRKLNYEIHGNTIPHLHLHLYPRYEGDPYEGRPIDHRAKFQRSPANIDRIALAIRTEVERS
jgi:diadenosine tetraphosphate (Ap4A) HIT family hydrolase